MKNLLKLSAGVAAAAAVVAVAVAPVAVNAWSDSWKGGRPSYTIDQINNGVLGNNIVFNSISNGVIGDEKNFVGAREADAEKQVVFAEGKNGKRHLWNGNEIEVKENKDYVVRLYVHNNNPLGQKAIAEDVTVAMNFGDKTANSMRVGGYINTKNAGWYYDDVVLKSDKPFRLAYVAGSAKLENNNGTFALSDDIVKKNGVKVGPNRDGKVPGCFEYAQYVSITVRPVFEKNTISVRKYVRKHGDKEWKDFIVAQAGDTIEYAIEFNNIEGNRLSNVVVKDLLPKNIKPIAGTTKLYNGSFKKGLVIDDDLFSKGYNIGDYKTGSNAIVFFGAKVVDENLTCGISRVRNWGQAIVAKDKGAQDYADVMVRKTCNEAPKPTPKPNPVIPATGPTSVVFGILGAGSLAAAVAFYIASRKKLQ